MQNAKKKFIAIILIFFSLFINQVLYAQQKFDTVMGEYFGEQLPGNEAIVFAKNIISTTLYEHSAPAFSPDGNVVLWTVLEMNKPARLLEMTMQNNIWSAPHAPLFADTVYDDFYPFFSSDGQKLFFSSRRMLPSGSEVNDMRLWVVEREGNKWKTPVPIDSSVSKGFEYAHSVSKNGNLYFSARNIIDGKAVWKIYCSRFDNGNYLQPQPLDSNINNGSYVDGPLVSADEEFLIFESDRLGGEGSIDLYICFKKKNGEWSNPLNMGPKVNSAAAERFAGLSPDGKFLFFGSNRAGNLPDIYWMRFPFPKSFLIPGIVVVAKAIIN
jgi:Tol biopolymer transport system component